MERREKEAAAEKRAASSKKRDAQTELEKIRAEGKRMRMDKTQRLNEDLERESKLNLNVDIDEEAEGQDRVVRLKWSRKDRPAWTTASVVSNKDAIAAALYTYGAVSQVILPPLKETTASGKKPKSASGIVEYSDILGAFGAVQSSKRGVLDGVSVDWVGGVEPATIQQLRSSGKLDSDIKPASAPSTANASSAPSFDFTPQQPPKISYETETLMRMKERERLKQQILEEEGDD